jgi:Uma2 family endonuclease
MSSVPAHILEWRRRTGADQWDEMWEGVLHMSPSPNRDHQDFEFNLELWLRTHWAEPHGCRVYHQINVAEPGAWPDNYRIPDLVLLTPARFCIDRNEYFDGGPDAVVEIHSPDDEAYEKLDFYAKVGVLEVIIIDRDSKQPELLKLVDGEYHSSAADSNGWVQCQVAGFEMRASENEELEVRMIGRNETLARLP